MDIDLNLVEVRIPMRIDSSAEIVRPLNKADLKMLAVREATPDDAPIRFVKRLSARHHALARVLAEGAENWRAAAFTGYDEVYVSIMKADPTFQNLVQHYTDLKEQELVANARLVNGVAHDALMLIQDKMENEPEKVTMGQAIEVAKLGLDRSGVGPSTSVDHKHSHTINMADRLQAARLKADELRKTIDITPEKSDAA